MRMDGHYDNQEITYHLIERRFYLGEVKVECVKLAICWVSLLNI